MMVTIGVDPARDSLVAVAMPGEVSHAVANNLDGWQSLWEWAAQWPQHQWGIEGSGSLAAALTGYLLATGEQVVEVSPRLTARERQSAQRRGKTDHLDARAVALVAAREWDRLPQLQIEPSHAVSVRELSHHRDRLVAQQSVVRSQLAGLLARHVPMHGLDLRGRSKKGLTHVLALPLPPPASLVRDHLVADYGLLAAQLHQVECMLEPLISRHYQHMLAVPGMGWISVAAFIAEVGHSRPGLRPAQLASLAGLAPLDVSSGAQRHHRLNRGGNRRLNAVFYRIALTQMRHDPRAQAYLARRRERGGSTSAMDRRALERQLVRTVFNAWMACQQAAA
jgi:transposase